MSCARTDLALPLAVGLLAVVLGPAPARAGADTRGELGRFYLKVAYSDTRADEGYGPEGQRVSLDSNVFRDPITAFLSSDSRFRQKAVRVYAEVGLLPDLDGLFAIEWKEVENTFRFGIPAFGETIRADNQGLGDGMVGLKYRFLRDPLPLAAELRLVYPNYDTSVEDLNLTSLNSSDDEAILGKGTYDLILGLAASTGPWIPHVFGDLSFAYVLADLGAAAFVSGEHSTGNGSDPSRLTTGRFFFDPAERIVVANDQEHVKLGAQAWYHFHGLSLEATFTQIVDGQNLTRDRGVELGVSFQH